MIIANNKISENNTAIKLTRPPSLPTTLPFIVRTMGRIKNDPYHTTRGTYNQDAMLTVIESGSGFYVRDNQNYTITAGQIGLVLPDQNPGLLMANPEDPYQHYYCRFGGQEAVRIAQRVIQTCSGPAKSTTWAFFNHPSFNAVIEMISRITARGRYWHKAQAIERMTLIDVQLAEMLVALDTPLNGAKSSNPTAQALQFYLQDHLTEPIDLSEMANHFNISKTHLCRIAKKELGQTVQSLWEQIKMDHARILLIQSEMSIKEIAHRVGYHDPFYFSNVFRHTLGISPSEYRKKNKATS